MPEPEFRHTRAIPLAGTMAIYNSQAEATENIPMQWLEFLSEHPTEDALYGASPCTGDHKLHFLCGYEVTSENEASTSDRLTLEAGEYAVFTVHDIADLRDTWIWALSKWLPSSGRKEKNAPEFERYLSGTTTTGPVEMWIPLQP